MMLHSVGLRTLGAAAIVSLSLLAACKEKAQAPAPQAPEVGIVTLEPQRVALVTELPGRISARRVAEVRPQVSGIILKRLFVEGSEVKAGQQLYQIDPATYRAAYESSLADLAKAEATLKSAKAKASRYTSLVNDNAISKQDYDDAIAALGQDEATVAAARAAVDSAKINLDYTRVTAPISGRVGRSAVTEGALVTANQATALATVQELDPIYVDVTQSSVELLRLRRELAEGRLQTVGEGQAAAHLVLEDGTTYPVTGKLLFSEVTVDQGTGSVTLRAEFPNPARVLLPGMFVHARVEEGVNEQAILVPQQGVTRNSRGEPTALVVGQGDKVELRVLKVDRAVGDKWLVASGMNSGDRVIVEGLQRVRPGMPVRTVVAGNVAPNQVGANQPAK